MVPAAEQNPRLPPAVNDLCMRCLAKDPAQRYQQAAEVQAALEAVQSASFASPRTPNDQRGPTTTVLRGMRHLAVKNGDVLLLVGLYVYTRLRGV